MQYPINYTVDGRSACLIRAFLSPSQRVDGPGGHQAVMFSWKLQSYKSLFVNRIRKNAVKELHRLYF